MKRDDLKILLLQIREDEETALEEFYEFVQYSKLREDQFTVLNVYNTKNFDNSIIMGHDALFVGGSSDATVLKPEEFEFVTSCMALIRYCYKQSIPVLSSCFGFQLSIQEFGGTIIYDHENIEMGTYPIFLTELAKSDPLLYDYPASFMAISGHKERAHSVPENTLMLGYSEKCPYHIVKFIDKPFYAFQFHPETDYKDLVTRITRYRDRYFEDDSVLEDIKRESCRDVSLANSLIEKFVDRVILPHYEKNS